MNAYSCGPGGDPDKYWLEDDTGQVVATGMNRDDAQLIVHGLNARRRDGFALYLGLGWIGALALGILIGATT